MFEYLEDNLRRLHNPKNDYVLYKEYPLSTTLSTTMFPSPQEALFALNNAFINHDGFSRIRLTKRHERKREKEVMRCQL